MALGWGLWEGPARFLFWADVFLQQKGFLTGALLFERSLAVRNARHYLTLATEKIGVLMPRLYSCAHCAGCEEASSAIDRPPLRWVERNGRLIAALGAGHSHFNPLLDSGNLGRGNRCQSIVLGLLARLAALRFILQTLVVKENLLANSPNELLAAIDAANRSVLKVRRRFRAVPWCFAV